MTATVTPEERIFALSQELEDAVALWTAGREHLQQMRADGAGVVLALLAAGAEKLLKLTLGLCTLDTEGDWPSVQVMRQRWGHQIALLDEHVGALLLSRSHLSQARPFIKVLVRSATTPSAPSCSAPCRPMPQPAVSRIWTPWPAASPPSPRRASGGTT